jgi:hypothetical protein
MRLNHGSSLVGSPDFGVFPCTFPAYQGSAPETSSLQTARTAIQACGCRDFPRIFRCDSKKSRDSAGFWRTGYRVSEPETAGSRPRRHNSPRFSLMASWAVRIRFRFAPTKDWVQTADGAWIKARVPQTRGLSRQHNHFLKSI